MGVRVQTADFDLSMEVAALTTGRTDIGAIVTFTGTVRGEANGQPIALMSLEHYPGMTEAELARAFGMKATPANENKPAPPVEAPKQERGQRPPTP